MLTKGAGVCAGEGPSEGQRDRACVDKVQQVARIAQHVDALAHFGTHESRHYFEYHREEERLRGAGEGLGGRA